MFGNSTNPLKNYLINYNASDWANTANNQLQSALSQALQFSKQYSQQAVNAMQDYNNQSQQQIKQGFARSQALNAPQQLATYNALDAYQNLLGLPTVQGGSFQLARNMENSAMGQPLNAQQQQAVSGYKQGLLQGVQ